jgi:hypothetical protein
LIGESACGIFADEARAKSVVFALCSYLAKMSCGIFADEARAKSVVFARF